jgi:energy-converting hydrogenase Eha subunit E
MHFLEVAMRYWRWLLAIQGGYYCATGIWPWISLSTFEAVTGPKVDDWLVQTVGALAFAIGATLLCAAFRETISVDVRVLSVLSALAFGMVDVTFVAIGRISRIYLVDAMIQILVLAVAVFLSTQASRGQKT